MQVFENSSPSYSPYSGFRSGMLGRPEEHHSRTNPCLGVQPWNQSSALLNPFGNFVPYPPFYASFYSPFDHFNPQTPQWSNQDLNPATVWARGVTSPCFHHDHHIIIRNSRPPFSAGNWETDRRHMIEIQFDQFGVASHCRSMWGRMGPWRADRYRHGVQAASLKLQLEISMLISRLDIYSTGRPDYERQHFDAMIPPWPSGSGYDYSTHNFRYVEGANSIDPMYNTDTDSLQSPLRLTTQFVGYFRQSFPELFQFVSSQIQSNQASESKGKTCAPIHLCANALGVCKS